MSATLRALELSRKSSKAVDRDRVRQWMCHGPEWYSSKPWQKNYMETTFDLLVSSHLLSADSCDSHKPQTDQICYELLPHLPGWPADCTELVLQRAGASWNKKEEHGSVIETSWIIQPPMV